MSAKFKGEMTEPSDHDSLVDKTSSLHEEAELVGDKWGQGNDSAEPRYIWGYTLGSLLILVGLVFSGFDWDWTRRTENPDASLADMSGFFWFGIAVLVSGWLLLDKKGLGWYLLFVCLAVAGWTFLELTFDPFFDESSRMFFGEIAVGIFAFLAAQIWYWRRLRGSS